MPLLSKEELLKRAPKKDANRHADFERSKGQVRAALAKSEPIRDSVIGRGKHIAKAAELRGRALRRQLPKLRKAAESDASNNRDVSQAAYLSAVQEIRHCEQVRQRAMRSAVLADGE